VPVEFLSDAEAAAFGRFDGAVSREELDRVFFLDDADRATIPVAVFRQGPVHEPMRTGSLVVDGSNRDLRWKPEAVDVFAERVEIVRAAH
jgi:hypothetical protein